MACSRTAPLNASKVIAASRIPLLSTMSGLYADHLIFGTAADICEARLKRCNTTKEPADAGDAVAPLIKRTDEQLAVAADLYPKDVCAMKPASCWPLKKRTDEKLEAFKKELALHTDGSECERLWMEVDANRKVRQHYDDIARSPEGAPLTDFAGMEPALARHFAGLAQQGEEEARKNYEQGHCTLEATWQ